MTPACGVIAALIALLSQSGPSPALPQQEQIQPTGEPVQAVPVSVVEAAVVPQTTVEPPALPLRKTIAPWIIDVYGRNYDNFTNEGASRVVSDWMTNALIDLDLFNVVNRERIRAVLSEQSLKTTGFARDISRDVPENELATAGKLLSVNYILLGNIKNLGVNTEVDFKLLDVETTTYSPEFRLNFLTPFNPSIEKIKSVIDRVVADLARSFPLVAHIQEITPGGKLVLQAGSSQGLSEGLSVELWHRYSDRPNVTGLLTRVDFYTSEVELDQPLPSLTITDYVARIAVAPGPEAVLSNGRLKLERGDLESARDIFADGLRDYPDHSRLLSAHAHTSWQLRDYETSVASYREALRLEPNDLELLEEAVQVLYEAGQFQEVVELLRGEGVAERSLALELYLGQALAIKGYPLLAREAYKRAFRLDPEDPTVHLRLSVLAAQTGELDEMAREIRLSAQVSHSTLEAQLAEVIVNQVGQDPATLADGLEPWVEQARKAGDFSALATAGELLLHDPSNWQTVLRLADESTALNPSYLRNVVLAARALKLGGRTEDAIVRLEQALQSHPNNVTLLIFSGELLSQTGAFDKAELRLQQAMDLAPDEWRPADALGDHYYRQRQYLKAVGAYQTALITAERFEGADLVPRLVELGRAAVLGNQHTVAQSYLERCVDTAPDNTECRYYLGICYFASNLTQLDDRAIVNLKASTDFAKDSSYYLGALYDRRNEFEAARDWYTRCVEAACSFSLESQQRVDAIETIAGTVIGQSHNGKEVSLDVGRIHGVLPGQIAIVLSQRKIIGRVRTEEVQERATVALVKGGKPKTGHEVRFRPARPKHLTIDKAPKRGVVLRWHPNTEPELVGYQVERREAPNGRWKVKKELGTKKTEFFDKSAKRGRLYVYRVTAWSKEKLKGLPSREVEIRP